MITARNFGSGFALAAHGAAIAPDATGEFILADMEKTFEILAPGTSFVPLCFAVRSRHLPFIGRNLAILASKYHSPRP